MLNMALTPGIRSQEANYMPWMHLQVFLKAFRNEDLGKVIFNMEGLSEEGSRLKYELLSDLREICFLGHFFYPSV